ncbi:MAG: hypothetical protein ACI934_001600 [Pseudohongiellaceae bacterium]|jgi:hypothetical protein
MGLYEVRSLTSLKRLIKIKSSGNGFFKRLVW